MIFLKISILFFHRSVSIQILYVFLYAFFYIFYPLYSTRNNNCIYTIHIYTLKKNTSFTIITNIFIYSRFIIPFPINFTSIRTFINSFSVNIIIIPLSIIYIIFPFPTLFNTPPMPSP